MLLDVEVDTTPQQGWLTDDIPPTDWLQSSTLRACSQHMNWTATSRPSYTTRSLATRVSVTTWLAATKLERLVLSQFEQFSSCPVNKPWESVVRLSGNERVAYLIVVAQVNQLHGVGHGLGPSWSTRVAFGFQNGAMSSSYCYSGNQWTAVANVFD